MLDTHRLRLLREFAERGTIVAAAAALGYTPSAVSQQLATLEREAGVALLDRTARTAELTDSGRRLAAHAERILALVEEAEADLAGREPSGGVVVTAFATAAVAFAPALARAVRAHSGLTLLLRQAAAGEGLRQVRTGEADIALIDDWSGRVPGTARGALRFRHLIDDPLVLVVPRGHPAASPGEPVDLRELFGEPWMAAPAGEPSRQAVDRLLAGAGGAPPAPWSSRAWPRSSAWSPAASGSPRCRGWCWRPASAGWPSGSCPLAPRRGPSTQWPGHRASTGRQCRRSWPRCRQPPRACRAPRQAAPPRMADKPS